MHGTSYPTTKDMHIHVGYSCHQCKCFFTKLQYRKPSTIKHKRPFVSKEDNLLFTSNLSWNEHYNCTLRRSVLSLNLIRRTVPPGSSIFKLKKALYLTLVRSHLSYCSQVWRPFKLKDIRISPNKSN